MQPEGVDEYFAERLDRGRDPCLIHGVSVFVNTEKQLASVTSLRVASHVTGTWRDTTFALMGGGRWPPRCHSCKAEPQRANTPNDRHHYTTGRRQWGSCRCCRQWQEYFLSYSFEPSPPIYSRALLRVLTPLTYKFIASRWGRCSQTWSDGLGHYSAHYVDDFRCS